MRLLTQNNRWSCVLYSVAMCINRDPSELITHLGHDGSEILYPDLQDPYCRRAFAIEEFATYLYNHSFCLMPFVRGGNCNGKDIYFRCDPPLHMVGVLTYGRHAVAWDGHEVFDPIGLVRKLDYSWDVFWMIVLLKQTRL